MDSGGKSGRAWQRNAGKSWAEMETGSKFVASVHTFGEQGPKLELSLEVATATYMIENLEFYPDLQDEYDAWLSEHDGIGYGLEEFSGERSHYSANWESNLTQEMNFVKFEWNGEEVVLLQTHNGADIRGGLSSPVAYIFVGDDSNYFGRIQPQNIEAGSYYWHSNGVSDNWWGDLYKFPVLEFFPSERLGQDLEALASYPSKFNTEDNRYAMSQVYLAQVKEDFKDFCASLPNSVVLWNEVAYFVDEDGDVEKLIAVTNLKKQRKDHGRN